MTTTTAAAETTPLGTVLSIRDLSVSYQIGRSVRPAIDGISLDIKKNTIVAIVGESGSGKSTLAHAIVRLLPSNARIEQGSVCMDGRDLVALPEPAMRTVRGSRIGFVPQDPMMSLNPTMQIGPQVAEALTLHRPDMTGVDVEAKVVSLLEEAGLPDATNLTKRYPHELSGGMRQRVLVAIAFALSPSLIIADEPTSALDATVSGKVLDTLKREVVENGVTLLIITHDLALAARHANEVIVMSQGRVVETGSADQVFNEPQHEYTRGLVANSLHLRPRSPRTLDLGTAKADVVVSVEGVTKVYPQRGQAPTDVPAVSGVSFDVRRGSTFALVGESGSGKSTTVRMILGLETITSGTVNVFGKDIGTLSLKETRELYKRMQVVYQSPYASLDPSFSLRRIIAEPLAAFGVGDRKSRNARALELLERVGLPASFAKRRPKELSGGQRQRVAIARALAISPDLVICDEPVSALDASVQAQILNLLVEIQRELGVTYIFISHDLAVVADIAHSVGVMQRGQLVEVGSAASVLTAPEHPYTLSLLESAYGDRSRAGVAR
jgi:peptide/nickel transport system ATP-binding protein